MRDLLGRRSDWHLRRPRLIAPTPGLHWLGPLLVLASVAVSWPAFDGAIGEDGSVSFGLFIGAASIVLMAWSFVLAVRLRVLEPLFGGLDAMYRVHRWAGTLAVVAMYLHTQNEPEIENGVRGASKSVADAAEGLAGTGETMLYVLVAVSLIRWVPYRWWRWTHKLLGIPFVFASWHFFTAEKPYENSSGWGIYFGAVMAAGVASFVARVLVRDPLLRGAPYRVGAAVVRGQTLELELEPRGEPLEYEAGQFAVVKIQHRGLSEPHIFTIASGPDEGVLRFFIRNLGDWTAKLLQTDLVGVDVIIEGPYGRFEPTDADAERTVWVAGGVGITPFLAAIETLRPTSNRPTLFYAVKSETTAMAISVLQAAAGRGVVDLVICSSEENNRFTEDLLIQHLGPDGLRGAHVAVCGPHGLVSTVREFGHRHGALRVEHEDFDIRQGFGPDMSVTLEGLLRRPRVLPRQ